jgi:hypothetical protein
MILAKDHCGREYKSLSAMARQWGISVNTFMTRITVLGWTIEKALTTPIGDNAQHKKPITYKGVKYDSLGEFATAMGIKKDIVYARYKAGYTAEEIVEVPFRMSLKNWRVNHETEI